jgi:hypothetical protein
VLKCAVAFFVPAFGKELQLAPPSQACGGMEGILPILNSILHIIAFGV